MANIPKNLGLARMVADVRIVPTLAFYDSVFAMAQKLEPDYKYWQTDIHRVQFTDPARRCIAILRHDGFGVDMDLPGNVDSFKNEMLKIGRLYLASPHIKSVARVGMRAHYFHCPDFTFPELLAVFAERLLRDIPAGYPFLTGQLRDMMFNVVVDEPNELKTHLIAGPVRRGELSLWTRTNSYQVGQAPEPIEYPEIAAFFDIDVYSNAERAATTVETVIYAAADAIGRTARGIVNHLFEGGKR